MVLLVCCVILQIVNLVTSSPFDLTDRYVTDFRNELETFKRSAEEYVFNRENHNLVLPQNETTAYQEATVDFIVIGAGASGSVVASRLSEVPEWNVLLLEAGGPETRITEIPSMENYLQHSEHNWAFTTTPQKNWCQGMIDHKCAIAGGKGLGGGTAINGMLFTRGHKKDYDLWADRNNSGWCYDDVLPYFKKLEDADLHNFDYAYHNRGGPLHIQNPQELTHLAQDILEVGKELGYDTVDFNGRQQLGLGVAQVNLKHGKRQSTAKAYLEPAAKRTNLNIQVDSHVVKIMIDPETKIASGVFYKHNHKVHFVKARKEVILSAGALNSPQLLLLSGVGPKEHLEKLSIPVIKELNVGHNLKDHPAYFGLDFVYNQTVESPGPEHDEVVDYLKNGKGPLTTANGVQVLAYLQTEVSKDTTHYPDVELFFLDRILKSEHKINPQRFTDEVFDSVWKPHEGKKALNIGVMVAHPKSVGAVTLQDWNALHHPLVDPNLFSDPEDEDMKTMLAGIRLAMKFGTKLGLEVNKSPVKGCEGFPWDSEEFWICSIKHLTRSLRHVTGTVRMGPEFDKDAVVDNKLRVYGIHNLRVIDASVIPVTITGHTMAAAIMIGEKGSDLIKADWSQTV